MAYTKTVWRDKAVQFPNRYDKSLETSSSVTLIQNAGTITDAGVPLNAANLNNIELGIGQANWFGTTTNVGNAYSVTLDPIPTAYYSGMTVRLKINAAASGAVSINVNGLGAKSVKTSQGAAVSNWALNAVVTVTYNGTDFTSQGEGSAGNAVAGDIKSGRTATVITGDIVGTMPIRTGDTVALSSAVSGNTLRLRASDGYRDGVSDFVTITDADWTPPNILSNKDVFGVVGSLLPYTFGTGANGAYNPSYSAPVLVPNAVAGGTAANLTDGNTATTLVTNPLSFTGMLTPAPICQVDLGGFYEVTSVSLQQLSASSGGNMYAQYSVDGTNWFYYQAVGGTGNAYNITRSTSPANYTGSVGTKRFRYYRLVHGSGASISYTIGDISFTVTPNLILLNPANEDKDYVTLNCTTFNLAAGLTLSTVRRSRGLLIYSLGAVTISGTIDLSSWGGWTSVGSPIFSPLYNITGSRGAMFTPPLMGGAGGAAGTVGPVGVNTLFGPFLGGGSRIGLGGFGAGGMGGYADNSNGGSSNMAGCPYPDYGMGGYGGGSGFASSVSSLSNDGNRCTGNAGGGGSTFCAGMAVNQSSGYGGDSQGAGGGGGGSAGHNGGSGGTPNTGTNGTAGGGVGGAVIIAAGGNVTIASGAFIKCNGGNGGNGGNSVASAAASVGGGGGGGGAGGGTIGIYYFGIYSNLGTLQVLGGSAGSNGTATLVTGTNYTPSSPVSGSVGSIVTQQLL